VDNFVLGISCNMPQCDELGLLPPPCVGPVFRDGVGSDNNLNFQPFPTGLDPYTGVRGYLVQGINIAAGTSANVVFVFKGTIGISSIPITFGASGQGSGTTEQHACLAGSVTGPNCVDCLTNPTGTMSLRRNLQSMWGPERSYPDSAETDRKVRRIL
jgi:hypothetical protein